MAFGELGRPRRFHAPRLTWDVRRRQLRLGRLLAEEVTEPAGSREFQSMTLIRVDGEI